MKITMQETRRGSEDAFTVKCFEAGQTYDVAHGLACQFVAKGWAKEAPMESYEVFSEFMDELTKQPKIKEHFLNEQEGI